jgi:hypothetical protein
MSPPLPPTELLTLINSMIVNIVGTIEYIAPIALFIGLLMFTAWLIVQCGRLIHDIIAE